MQLKFITWFLLATTSLCYDLSEHWPALGEDGKPKYDAEGVELLDGSKAALEKGLKRYQEMNDIFKDYKEDSKPMEWCDIEKVYKPRYKKDVKAAQISSRLEDFLDALRIGDKEDKSWHKVHQFLFTDEKNDAPGDEGTALYENAYNTDYNAIAVVDINRPSKDVGADVTTMTWATWLKVCEDNDKDPKNLEYMIHYTCRNPTAEALSQDIFGPSLGFSVTEEFTPGKESKDTPFYALLGLDNGTSAKNLPTNYWKALDKKKLKSITAWRDADDLVCMGVAYRFGKDD